jgi:hypothetical protein
LALPKSLKSMEPGILKNARLLGATIANRALWPICHYRLDLAILSECNAAAYFRVNEQYARQLHKLLQRALGIAMPSRPGGLVIGGVSTAWLWELLRLHAGAA